METISLSSQVIFSSLRQSQYTHLLITWQCAGLILGRIEAGGETLALADDSVVTLLGGVLLGRECRRRSKRCCCERRAGDHGWEDAAVLELLTCDCIFFSPLAKTIENPIHRL